MTTLATADVKTKEKTTKMASLSRESSLKAFLVTRFNAFRRYPLSVLIYITIANYAVAFVISEYLERQTFSSILSYSASDAPGPLETQLYLSHPIIGQHYFGDAFQTAQTARLFSPYLSQNGKLISQYPPAAHILFWPLNLLNAKVVILVFVIFTILCILWAVTKIAHVIEEKTRPLFICIVLSSGAVVSTIDRGSLNGIIFALVVLGLFTKNSRSDRIAALFIATSLKLYPAIFLFELVKDERQSRASSKWLLITFPLASLSMLISSFFYFNGSWTGNVSAFLRAFNGQGFGPVSLKQLPGHSLEAFIDVVWGPNPLSFYSMIALKGTVLAICSLLLALQFFGGLSKHSFVEDRLIIMTICFCLIPTVVGTSQLIFFIIPLAMILSKDVANQKISLRAVVLAILILPRHYLIGADIYLDSFVSAPLMLILLIATFTLQIRRAES